MDEINDLARQAASSLGLLTTADLEESGFSRKQRYRLVRDGVLCQRHPGVYSVFGSASSWEQDVYAACLAGGPVAAASHRSACRLNGFRSNDAEVEIVVRFPRDPRFKDVRVHRSRDFVEFDVERIGVIPVTSPIRTICDAGLVFPHHEVARMARHAVATGRVTADSLAAYRQRVGRKGRTGVVALDEALDSMPAATARLESGPEIALAKLVESADLPLPTRQLDVVVGGAAYRFDLAYPDSRIAIEYDGFDVHTRPDRFARDRRRQNDVVLAGWTVLRFTHADLTDRPYDIVRTVRASLKSAVL